ncbi:transglutaminase TgpA family protein [Planctomicrobium sp. SH668]|uniref:transglutaminase TgpA family protein n=1 Tax=Planctomicrobium sp. SH668 TaxID=3448126 RepID=UPI003F5B8F32
MTELFQFSMTVLMSLTGLTSAVAEGNPLSALTVPFAFASFYFVDLKRFVVLPKWLAPALGAVAFGIAAIEYGVWGKEHYLLVANHLLAYLTWVILLQQKGDREYWTLMALSILQIAITSLLTFSVWFGIGLLAYVFVALWSMSIFLLFRSVNGIRASGIETSFLKRNATKFSSFAQVWSGVSRDHSEKLVTTPFYLSSVSVSGVAIFIAMLFFIFIPRIWPTARSSLAGAPVTGFSSEVRLGEIGEILENPDKVMTFQLYRADTESQLSVMDAQKYLGAEPLFRGAVLEEYRNGRWSRPELKGTMTIRANLSSAKYRFRITLEPIGTDSIFSFGNTIGALTAKRYGSINWDVFSSEIRRGEETDLDRAFSYDLFTADGPPDLWMSQMRHLQLLQRFGFDPTSRTLTPLTARRFQASLRALSTVPPELHPLEEVSRKVVGNAPSDTIAAQRIEDWFTTSGEFDYTMKLSVSDSAVDPVLDFVTNRKTGHCEYFASAMAMMLRSVGIPSRVITGFKGANVDPKTGVFTVQQLHAHAWVEAYLDGTWVTFDPTPASRDDAVHQVSEKVDIPWYHWRKMEVAWSRFSTISRESQQERVYEPLKKQALSVKTAVTELFAGRADRFKELMQFFVSPKRWFTSEGVIVASLLAMLLLACSWLVRRLLQASRSMFGLWKGRSGPSSLSRPAIAFYDRFLKILEEQKLVQAPTQTAQEFLLQVKPELLQLLPSHQHEVWIDSLVQQFYRVRFGHEQLTQDELNELDQRLNELEAGLHPVAESTR